MATRKETRTLLTQARMKQALSPGVAMQIAIVVTVVAIPRFFGDQISAFVRPFVRPLADHPTSILTEASLILGALFFGTCLYAFRCRWPRWYGTIEIIVGLSVATYVLDPLLSGLSSGASVYFTAVGALYVVVRGYDNIYKSMTSGAAGTLWWNRWFFGSAESGKL